MSEAGTSPAGRRGTELVPFAALRPLPPAARFSLRGELAVLARALEPGRVPVSQHPCRAVAGDLCTALWLGPDEQLLLTSDQQGLQLAQVLQTHLMNVPHALVDISHRQTAFEVVGPSARTLLNAGCPLDLDQLAFPVGMCTRTLFEKSEVVLWRRETERFHVEVWRSFAPYVTGLLLLAEREATG